MAGLLGSPISVSDSESNDFAMLPPPEGFFSTQSTILDNVPSMDPTPPFHISDGAPSAGQPEPPQLVPNLDRFTQQGSELLWVSAGGKVFSIHAFMLARSSKFFAEMLSSVDGMGEGRSKQNPLILDGHGTQMEWYALLDFLYPACHDEDPVERNQAYWVALLSISHKYEITGAFRDAKQNLLADKHEPLSHTLKLNLGCRFEIWDWVLDSLKTVVHIPAAKLTPLDISNLGPDLTYELFQLHFGLTSHRAYTSIFLPSVFPKNAPGCTSPANCYAAWKDVCLILNRKLVDPRKPAKDWEILQWVTKREKPLEVLLKIDRFCYARILALCQTAFDGKDYALIDHVTERLKASVGLPAIAPK